MNGRMNEWKDVSGRRTQTLLAGLSTTCEEREGERGGEGGEGERGRGERGRGGEGERGREGREGREEGGIREEIAQPCLSHCCHHTSG